MKGLKEYGIKRATHTDKNGVRFIDYKPVPMSSVLGDEIEVFEYVFGVNTTHGNDRCALGVLWHGKECKLIVNAAPIKGLLKQMKENDVTRFKTVFVDNGGKHYDYDYDRTMILEVGGKIV